MNVEEITRFIENLKKMWKILIGSFLWIIVWQTVNTILIAILFWMVWGLYR